VESNNYIKESEELMRVKLSYTAEIEEVLPEAAYMLKNLGETINDTIKDYNELLVVLGDEEAFNAGQFYKIIDDVRLALGKLDYRLVEVSEIVAGYEDYQRETRRGAQDDNRPPDIAQEAVVYVEEDPPDEITADFLPHEDEEALSE